MGLVLVQFGWREGGGDDTESWNETIFLFEEGDEEGWIYRKRGDGGRT